MDGFTIRGAWTHGLRVLARHWLLNLLFLLGLGIVVPALLQTLLWGRPLGLVNQSVYGVYPGGELLTDNPFRLLVMAVGYACAVGATLATLRLGLAARPSLPGALLWGLVAGLLAAALLAGVHVLAELGGKALAEPDLAPVSAFVFLAPLALIFLPFYFSQMLMMAAAGVLVVAIAMVWGIAMGEPGYAATLVGGSGGTAVMLVVLGGLLLWLAARLSCVTPLLAERGGLNLWAAIRDSWALTLDDQAAIFRYLALVGAVPALLVLGVSILLGLGGNVILRDGHGLLDPETLVRLAVAIPFALLSVMIPAGIYRQLTSEAVSAEVFA